MTGSGTSDATPGRPVATGGIDFRGSTAPLAPSRILSRGGWGNPDVYLVVKDFAARSRPIRALIGPWLIRREMAAYRRLAGMTAVPRLLGPVGRCAFALEYRPGTLLSRALRGRLPPDFLAELEAAVREMHRRGVVHLDLRHRSNVLAGDDARPVLLDFASALRFDPETWWGRLAVWGLGRVDHGALAKWRSRLGD